MNRFWPCREAAQADYEALREQVLNGVDQIGPVVERFRRFGLAGLIALPASEPVWVAGLAGARRPPWTPHLDPRMETLATGYEMVLASLLAQDIEPKEARL